MKRILCFTTLVAWASLLEAKPGPNRGDIGETLFAAPPPPPGEVTPSATDKPPGAANPDTTSGKSADERFIYDAWKAGKMEVKLAELAVTQATREDLKAYAATLVKDHSTANAELAEIAKSLGVDLPDPLHPFVKEESDSVRPGGDGSGRLQKDGTPRDPGKEGENDGYNTLKDKTGMAFDAAFMQFMKECHTKDIALYERVKGKLRAPALQTFATKMLPVLKAHEEALAELERKDPNRPDAKTGSRAAGRPHDLKANPSTPSS